MLGGNEVKWLAKLFNQILSESKIPDGWMKSYLVLINKNKEKVHESESYRGIKLI